MGFRHKFAAEVRIAHGGFFVFQRVHLFELTPGRQAVKRRICLKRQDRIQRPTMDLEEHPAASGSGFIRQVKIRLPAVRGAPHSEHAIRHRYTGIDCQGFQALLVFVDTFWILPRIFPRNLKNARTQFAHHTDQLADFVPVGQTAGDRLALWCLVITCP